MKRFTIVLAVAAIAGAMTAAFGADEAKPPEAKAIFLKSKCNSCHTLSAQGISKVVVAEEDKAVPAVTKTKAPDLSAVGVDRKAEWISKYLQRLEAKKEKKHIKKFRGTNAELQTLAAWLAEQKDAEAAKKPTAGTTDALKEAQEAKEEAKEAKEEAKEAKEEAQEAKQEAKEAKETAEEAKEDAEEAKEEAEEAKPK